MPGKSRWAIGGEPRAFEGDEEVEVSSFRFTKGLLVAGDGSAEAASWRQLARAGWAAVQWDPGKNSLRGIWEPVHRHNPQVAPK